MHSKISTLNHLTQWWSWHCLMVMTCANQNMSIHCMGHKMNYIWWKEIFVKLILFYCCGTPLSRNVQCLLTFLHYFSKQPDTLSWRVFFSQQNWQPREKCESLTQIQGTFTLVSESVVLVGNDIHFFQVIYCGKIRAYNSDFKKNLKCIP